jgi:hypothetical protein
MSLNPQAVNNLILLTSVVLDLGMKFQQATMAQQRALLEGRDITDDELLAAVGSDDAARARLQAVIDARSAQPPLPGAPG